MEKKYLEDRLSTEAPISISKKRNRKPKYELLEVKLVQLILK